MPFAGEKIIYQATCSSTNTVAMQFISTKQVPEGTIIITDCQTQGKGQRSNTWTSEPYKNLTFSMILYPTWLGTQDSFFLNMMTTVGIYQVLTTYIPTDLLIKWPNDIYVHDKKIGGVLIENVVRKNKIKASVVGIGLNVNQTNFISFPHASSLTLICGHEFNLSSLLMQLTAHIQQLYRQFCQEGIHVFQQAYLQHLYGRYEKKTFQDKEGYFQGIIQGIDEVGRLVVAKENKGLAYYSCQEIKFVG